MIQGCARAPGRASRAVGLGASRLHVKCLAALDTADQSTGSNCSRPSKMVRWRGGGGAKEGGAVVSDAGRAPSLAYHEGRTRTLHVQSGWAGAGQPHVHIHTSIHTITHTPVHPLPPPPAYLGALWVPPGVSLALHLHQTNTTCSAVPFPTHTYPHTCHSHPTAPVMGCTSGQAMGPPRSQPPYLEGEVAHQHEIKKGAEGPAVTLSHKEHTRTGP